MEGKRDKHGRRGGAKKSGGGELRRGLRHEEEKWEGGKRWGSGERGYERESEHKNMVRENAFWLKLSENKSLTNRQWCSEAQGSWSG